MLDTPGFGRGYTCSLAGMSSLGRSGRCIHTAETRPTGRSRGKSRRVSQKTDPRKNRAHRRNRPTPGFSAMRNRNGKPEQKPYGKPRSGICFVHEWRSRMGLGDSRPQTRNGFRPPPITHQATERSRAAAGGQRTATQQDRSRPTSLKAAAAAVPPRRAGYPMPTPGLIFPFSAPSLLAPGSSSRSTKPYCSASFASR